VSAGIEVAEFDTTNPPVEALPVYWTCLRSKDWIRLYGAASAGLDFRPLLDLVFFEAYRDVRRFLLTTRRGPIGFFHLLMGRDRDATISGGLIPEGRSRGFGPGCLVLALEHSFSQIGLQAVTVHIEKYNQNSLRMAERIGFRLESHDSRYLLRIRADQFANPFVCRLARRHRIPKG
jgi:RimJ/RimL family protein N-acetyltransferase